MVEGLFLDESVLVGVGLVLHEVLGRAARHLPELVASLGLRVDLGPLVDQTGKRIDIRAGLIIDAVLGLVLVSGVRVVENGHVGFALCVRVV